MAKASKKGTKPPPTNKPAEIVRQYSESHQFLKAKKAPKGAGFAFADGEVKSGQQPQDTGPPMVARTRSQARFLPINLPRPGRRSQKLPPPASPQRQPSIKVPTHYQAGWWITPFSPARSGSGKWGDSLKRLAQSPKRKRTKSSVQV